MHTLAGSGESAVAVSAAISGLASYTTYDFRIFAKNVGGESTGSDQTFTTTLVLGPHRYDNGIGLVQGETLKQLAWGTLALTNASTGTVTRKTAAGIETENPSGGGAGKGTLPGVIAYACVAPMGETAGGKAELVPEKLPWSSGADRRSAALPRQTRRHRAEVICAASEQSVQFHGSLKPEVETGTSIGATPEHTPIRELGQPGKRGRSDRHMEGHGLRSPGAHAGQGTRRQGEERSRRSAQPADATMRGRAAAKRKFGA